MTSNISNFSLFALEKFIARNDRSHVWMMTWSSGSLSLVLVMFLLLLHSRIEECNEKEEKHHSVPSNVFILFDINVRQFIGDSEIYDTIIIIIMMHAIQTQISCVSCTGRMRSIFMALQFNWWCGCPLPFNYKTFPFFITYYDHCVCGSTTDGRNDDDLMIWNLISIYIFAIIFFFFFLILMGFDIKERGIARTQFQLIPECDLLSTHVANKGIYLKKKKINKFHDGH
jgi:hypothetical protein